MATIRICCNPLSCRQSRASHTSISVSTRSPSFGAGSLCRVCGPSSKRRPLARHSMLPYSYGTCMIGSGTKDILTKTTTGQGSTPCTYRKLDSSVAVMQAADHDHGHGDGRFSDLDAELEQLAMDSRRTPQPVDPANLTDQVADFPGDRRPATSRPRPPALKRFEFRAGASESASRVW